MHHFIERPNIALIPLLCNFTQDSPVEVPLHNVINDRKYLSPKRVSTKRKRAASVLPTSSNKAKMLAFPLRS